MQAIELTEADFSTRAFQPSNVNPVLVEFRGTWCEDCQVLEGSQEFQEALSRIARGGVQVVSFEVSRDKMVQTLVNKDPSQLSEALGRGFDVTANPPYALGVETLSQYAVNSYPTMLLLDRGQVKNFYAEGQQQRRGRVVDTDLAQGKKGNRQVRSSGVSALVASVNWYMANRMSA